MSVQKKSGNLLEAPRKHTGDGKPAETYIDQPYVDTWCHLEDLPRLMAEKELKESVLSAHFVAAAADDQFFSFCIICR